MLQSFQITQHGHLHRKKRSFIYSRLEVTYVSLLSLDTKHASVVLHTSESEKKQRPPTTSFPEKLTHSQI